MNEIVVKFKVHYPQSHLTEDCQVLLSIRQVPALESLSADELRHLDPLQQTYWAPHPSASLLLPPTNISSRPTQFTTPVLALHGAGVSLHSEFWTNAIPKQKHSWVIVPGGGSAWGYDWQGPSLQDALAAVDTLRARYPDMAPGLVVLGHSNGGQGTLHIASRFPDLVRSLLPAAAYQSAPLYVANAYAYGVHFSDPALMAILHASLAGTENDLFFGNLVRSRVTLVHGGADTNVPSYHSASTVQIIKSWQPSADAR
jgi:pimeloyl-ACP methyl ester carboxylesterase